MVLSALIGGDRKRQKIRIAVKARETDILACIEKMTAVPITPCIAAIFSIAVRVSFASL